MAAFSRSNLRPQPLSSGAKVVVKFGPKHPAARLSIFSAPKFKAGVWYKAEVTGGDTDVVSLLVYPGQGKPPKSVIIWFAANGWDFKESDAVVVRSVAT